MSRHLLDRVSQMIEYVFGIIMSNVNACVWKICMIASVKRLFNIQLKVSIRRYQGFR